MLLQGAANAPARAGPAGRLDPTGVWNCLVYARLGLGNEHLKFRLTPDRRVAQSRGINGPWVPLSNWRIRRDRLDFHDPRTGRRYRGDLRYPTLGGTWMAVSLAGGWWCSSADRALANESRTLRRSASDIVEAPLVPKVTATPRYPLQAIREAKEGRAVACFLVDSEGSIIEPEFIELSDEIFRKSSIEALEHSQYEGWDDPDTLRPGCRTFIFTLDTVR